MKALLAISVALAAFSSCDGYTLMPLSRSASAPSTTRIAPAPLMQVEDEPEPPPSPAASTEPAIDIEPAEESEAEPVPDPEPEAAMAPDEEFSEMAIAKEALKGEISDGMTGPRPDKAVVGEILLALEAQNPTASPATSPLLNGKWKFLYATGASPGLKALMVVLKSAKRAPKSPSGADIVDVADTYLTISADQPRALAETKVRLLSFENTIKLASKLEAESAVRLVETYDAAESEYMSLRLPFQSPVQYKRSVLISYLDEEMLVVRDAMGRPDILMRVDEGDAFPATDDTASVDDAPGAS